MTSPKFRKQGPPSALAMFEAEAEGLAELKQAGAIRVPEVYDVGSDADGAYIEMQRFQLERGGQGARAALGEGLAALHRHTADLHGWHRDNTIGLTPQHNPQTDDWVAFFREHRLKFQLDLAAGDGYAGELQERGGQLTERLGDLFEGYEPAPSLVHGDLWAGNWGVADGVPVIFDPAVYYGDRETDIAMTRLFGGFGDAFYRAYERAWPLAAGSAERLELYKLYHVLNHLNLFGSGPNLVDTLPGVDLALIQRQLVTLGYEPGNTDGILDALTQVAISQYQAEHGMAVTGEPSSALASSLAAEVAQ